VVTALTLLLLQSCAYITDPFSVDLADIPVRTGEQEEMIRYLGGPDSKDKTQRNLLQ